MRRLAGVSVAAICRVEHVPEFAALVFCAYPAQHDIADQLPAAGQLGAEGQRFTFLIQGLARPLSVDAGLHGGSVHRIKGHVPAYLWPGPVCHHCRDVSGGERPEQQPGRAHGVNGGQHHVVILSNVLIRSPARYAGIGPPTAAGYAGSAAR